MSHELMITSAPRGLQPGSMGFCTVAMTPQLPSVLQQRLETLSSYRHVFPPMDARAKSNPVCFQHLRLQVGGKNYSVLSRIGDTGLDYTERSNKFGHHLALLPTERFPAGPAAAMLHPKTFQTAWKGEPRELEPHRSLAAASVPAGVARQWKAATGDSGWAGILGEMYLENQKDPVYVEYPAGTDVLPLFGEALALLPEEERWGVTFSTYFQGLPPELTCHWRGVVKDSPEAKQARSRNAKVISIHPGSTAPQGGVLAAWARTGVKPAVSEIMPSSEDNDLAPLTFKPERKGSRPESGQPFELKRDHQAKGSLRSELPPSKGSSFSVMSLLMGLLLGFLVSALVGLGVWFAVKGDPGLEVARDHEIGAAKEKIKKLEEQLIDNQKKSEKIEEELVKRKNSEVDLIRKLDDANQIVTGLNKRLEENGRAPAPLASKDKNQQSKDAEDPVVQLPTPKQPDKSKKEAIYFNFKDVAKEAQIKPDNKSFESAKLTSIKLLKAKSGFNPDLKFKETERSFTIYKTAAALAEKEKTILEVYLNDAGKAFVKYEVEEKDTAREEVLLLLRTSIIQCDTVNESYYITAIPLSLEKKACSVSIPRDRLDSNKNVEAITFEPLDKMITMHEGTPFTRNDITRYLKELIHLCKYDDTIKYTIDVNTYSNEYYDNTCLLRGDLCRARHLHKDKPFDPLITISSTYKGPRNKKKDGKLVEVSDSKKIEDSKPSVITIKSASLTFSMHGVDVPIWRLNGDNATNQKGSTLPPLSQPD